MTVSWNTFAKLPNPTVKYGRDPNHLSSTAYGFSTTYPTSRTYNNHVLLTNLDPDTKYYYLVSNSNCYNCSSIPEYSFTTARQAGDDTPFTAAVVVDMGTMGALGLSDSVGSGAANPLGPNDTNTVQSLVQFQNGFDLIWHRELPWFPAITEPTHGMRLTSCLLCAICYSW